MSKQTNDKLRQDYFAKVVEYFKSIGEDVLRVGTATLAIPCVDADGEDNYVEIVVKVPKGSKDEAYDGYALAEEYEMKAKEKAEKTAEAERKKKEKIERDNKLRAQRKEAAEKHKTNK